MITTRNLTLNSTPVELTVDTVIDTPTSISIQNTSNDKYAYIGGADVSSSNYGHKLFPAQSFSIDVNPYDAIYAVGDSGVTVAIFIQDKP